MCACLRCIHRRRASLQCICRWTSHLTQSRARRGELRSWGRCLRRRRPCHAMQCDTAWGGCRVVRCSAVWCLGRSRVFASNSDNTQTTTDRQTRKPGEKHTHTYTHIHTHTHTYTCTRTHIHMYTHVRVYPASAVPSEGLRSAACVCVCGCGGGGAARLVTCVEAIHAACDGDTRVAAASLL